MQGNVVQYRYITLQSARHRYGVSRPPPCTRLNLKTTLFSSLDWIRGERHNKKAQVVTGASRAKMTDYRYRVVASFHADFTRKIQQKSQKVTGEDQTRVFVVVSVKSHHITQRVHFSFLASDRNLNSESEQAEGTTFKTSRPTTANPWCESPAWL
jgi:hypothetical protein